MPIIWGPTCNTLMTYQWVLIHRLGTIIKPNCFASRVLLTTGKCQKEKTDYLTSFLPFWWVVFLFSAHSDNGVQSSNHILVDIERDPTDATACESVWNGSLYCSSTTLFKWQDSKRYWSCLATARLPLVKRICVDASLDHIHHITM